MQLPRKNSCVPEKKAVSNSNQLGGFELGYFSTTSCQQYLPLWSAAPPRSVDGKVDWGTFLVRAVIDRMIGAKPSVSQHICARDVPWCTHPIPCSTYMRSRCAMVHLTYSAQHIFVQISSGMRLNQQSQAPSPCVRCARCKVQESRVDSYLEKRVSIKFPSCLLLLHGGKDQSPLWKVGLVGQWGWSRFPWCGKFQEPCHWLSVGRCLGDLHT